MNFVYNFIFYVVLDDDWERLLDLIHQLVVEHPQVLMSARSTHAITGPFNQHPTKEHGVCME